MMTQTINIVINFGRREPLTEHRAEYDENRWALVVVPKHQKYITYVVYIFKREREREIFPYFFIRNTQFSHTLFSIYFFN